MSNEIEFLVWIVIIDLVWTVKGEFWKDQNIT